MKEREFTGRHAVIVFVSAFGVIIGVNLIMAYSAISTFPGLEVRNGYIASQQFESRRAAQEALGWTVHADSTDGMVVLAITDSQGNPVKAGNLVATIGRPTHVRDDVKPEFTFDGVNYVAPVDLATGVWNVRLKATALDGTAFVQRLVLHVQG